MTTASVEDMKSRLGLYLKASAKGPVVVTRDGKAIAVLLGVIDDSELEKILASRPQRLRDILEAAHHRIENGGGIGHDEFWKKVAIGAAHSGKKRATRQ